MLLQLISVVELLRIDINKLRPVDFGLLRMWRLRHDELVGDSAAQSVITVVRVCRSIFLPASLANNKRAEYQNGDDEH